jgi:hypothetical protein
LRLSPPPKLSPSLASLTGYVEAFSLASSDPATLLSLSETPRPPVKISPSDTHRRSVSFPLPLSLTLSFSLVRCCCSLVCYFLLLKA